MEIGPKGKISYAEAALPRKVVAGGPVAYRADCASAQDLLLSELPNYVNESWMPQHKLSVQIMSSLDEVQAVQSVVLADQDIVIGERISCEAN